MVSAILVGVVKFGLTVHNPSVCPEVQWVTLVSPNPSATHQVCSGEETYMHCPELP